MRLDAHIHVYDEGTFKQIRQIATVTRPDPGSRGYSPEKGIR